MCACTVWKREIHIHASIFGRIVDRGDGYDVDFVAAPSPHKVCMVVYEPEPVVCIATQPVRVTN